MRTFASKMGLFLIAIAFMASALMTSFHAHNDEKGLQSTHSCATCILKENISAPHLPTFLSLPLPLLTSQSVIIRNSYNLPRIKIGSAVSRAPPARV